MGFIGELKKILNKKKRYSPIGLHFAQLDFLTLNYKGSIETLFLIDKAATDSEKKAQLEEVEKAKNDLIEWLKLTHPTILIQRQNDHSNDKNTPEK
jgi:hypothetical protein